MAPTSRLPNGDSLANRNEQLPNCILASSNRFADLEPFCDNLYLSNKTKWGSILPFEFPQNATKDVEERFLRKFFTEVEIHMQGGAHGTGSGFRFLKQAWYSLALRNLYKGIPGIANKWMEENVALLEDPAMRGHLCEPEVTPETFFLSHEIQEHGRKLLTFVVPVIQAMTKDRHEQPVPRTSGAEGRPLTAIVAPVFDDGEGESRSTAPVMAGPRNPAASTTANRTLPSTHATAPTDPHAAPLSKYQGATSQRPAPRDSRDFTPSYNHHTQQINGRKRDNHNGSSSGARPLVSARRQSENHHHSGPNVRSARGGFSSGAPSFVNSVPGPMTAASSSTQFPFYGAMPGQPYHTQNSFNASRQQFSQPRHFSDHSDERFSNNKARNTSFNEFSNTIGDARRTSFGSRGGSIRGQHRGGRGRGGRGRDSFHGPGLSSDEQSSIDQASSDYYSKSGYGHVKRHSSAYQENTWRSSSEHPQVENLLPHRVLSGPDQYPAFQDYQGATGTRLLPPFIFPHGPTAYPQSRPTLHRSLQADMTQNSPELPDCEVGRTYIGADAVHVNQLVVFNIPTDATELEVAKAFAHACDVEVVDVRFPHRPDPVVAHVYQAHKLAIIKFRNHEVARRVLDLREVDLYGRPLRIEVPRGYVDENRPNPGRPFIPTYRNQSLYGLPPQDVNLWSHEPANTTVQPPQYNVQMKGGASFVQPSQASYASYMPSMPFYPAKGEQALSVVQSVNATPVASGPNTPKKQQSKNKKKNKKNKTPLCSEVEGENDVAHAKFIAHETPVKPSKQRQQDHPASLSNDMSLVPEQTQFLNKLSASEDAKELKPLQSGSSVAYSDDAVSANGKPLSETPQEPQGQELKRQSSEKRHNASKDAPASEPTIEPRTPSIAGPMSPSRVFPTTKQTSDHPHDCRPEVKSRTTAKVSPRSQVPVPSSNELVPSPNHAAVSSLSERHLLPSQPSPSLSGSIRPASVDRKLSDSDHVDESFHTASASPPEDKQIQFKDATAHSELPSQLAQPTSVKPTPRSSVSPSQTSKTVAPITPKRSPKAGVHASTQNTTPSEDKAHSAGSKKDHKLRNSTSQYDVPDVSGNSKAICTAQKTGECDNEVSTTSAITVPQHVLPATPNLQHGPTRNDMSDSRPNKQLTGSTQKRAVSSSSIPPTLAAANHNARTAPAPSQVSASPHSPGSSVSKSKGPAKKGPSQTESLSMFGKKQQKQKKPGKGKGTLKGKPLDSGSTSGLSDGINSRDSGVATPASTVNDPTARKRPSSLKVTTTTSRLDSTADNNSNPDDTKSTVSRQESPGKGGILGGLGRVFFSTASSPSVSGHETMPQDTTFDKKLTFSKALVALAPITSSNEGDLVDNESVTSDQQNSVMSNDTHVASLSASIFGNAEVREARRKKRNRDRKSKKKGVGQKGGVLIMGAKGDAGGTLVSLEDVPDVREVTSDARDLKSDNPSDESSTTMGRPTPPVSPKRLSESKRRRVENRMNGTEHIITPPAPRNRHIKRKSYSRSASSTTKQATSPTPAHPISETEIDQQNRILRVYHIENSDEDDDDPQQRRPRVLIIARSGENEGNRRFSLTADEESGRFKFIHFGQGGDDESDPVILISDRLAATRPTDTPVGRILEEVDSEDESSK